MLSLVNMLFDVFLAQRRNAISSQVPIVSVWLPTIKRIGLFTCAAGGLVPKITEVFDGQKHTMGNTEVMFHFQARLENALMFLGGNVNRWHLDKPHNVDRRAIGLPDQIAQNIVK